MKKMFLITKIIRSPNVRNYSRSLSKIDPGINRRKKLGKELDEEIDDDLDDMDSDFMSVHKTHREHVEEIKYMKEKEKFHIVQQKYFKEKYPNFLTWNDKEQIRYLHSTDPEEWTIERLSEGFPALPDVIMKIVKAKWSKKSTETKKHDLAVQKNWEMFKTGQIPNLPADLVQHLNKFTNRALNLKPFETPDTKKVIKVRNETKSTEFSDIISSYEKLKNKNKESEGGKTVEVNTTFTKPTDGTDTYLTVDKKTFKDKRLVTLHELQSKIETKASRDENLTADDKLVMQGIKEISVNEKVNENVMDVTKNKYETSDRRLLVKENERDYSHLIYPERISIPKDLRKRGYTYKLNDCYYDDDGRFLYRVPGMG